MAPKRTSKWIQDKTSQIHGRKDMVEGYEVVLLNEEWLETQHNKNEDIREPNTISRRPRGNRSPHWQNIQPEAKEIFVEVVQSVRPIMD